MKSVEYSQLVKRKLLKLKKELAGEYGEEKTKEILTAMADHVDMLGQHEESGELLMEGTLIWIQCF